MELADWQEWTVAALLLGCTIYIGGKLTTFLKKTKRGNNPCENCASGCELRDLYEKKSCHKPQPHSEEKKKKRL